MDTPRSDEIEVIDLGRLAYTTALATQRERHAAVVRGHDREAIFLVEHDPVVTISQRRNAAANLIASPQRLAALGIDVQPTDRGGDITYHGPGQLVVYPILRLADHGLNLSTYMRSLEAALVDALQSFGIIGRREPGATGVWATTPDGTNEKVAALGVRIARNVTMHGLALNVTTDLSHFDVIVPCGLTGRGVTSMERLLGDRTPEMRIVKARVIDCVRSRLRESRPLTGPR